MHSGLSRLSASVSLFSCFLSVTNVICFLYKAAQETQLQGSQISFQDFSSDVLAGVTDRKWTDTLTCSLIIQFIIPMPLSLVNWCVLSNINNWIAWRPVTKSCWKFCFHQEQQETYKRKNKTSLLKWTTHWFPFKKKSTTNAVMYSVGVGSFKGCSRTFYFFLCFPGRVGTLTPCFRLEVAVTAGEPRARFVANQNQRTSQQQVLLKFYETTAYVGLVSYVRYKLSVRLGHWLVAALPLLWC